MKRFLFILMVIISFAMKGWTQTPVTVPYSQNFEDTTLVSEWTFTSSNSTHTDMWHIGAATGNIGNSMYVSSDGGLTNSYVQFSTFTYASVLVSFGQAAEFALSFDWKGMGESCCDKFSVYIIPASTSMPTNGYPTGGVTILSPTNSQATWQNKNIILTSPAFANTTQRLIFVWYRDVANNVQPPAAVDNVVITSTDCGAPIGLAASNITTTSADLTWTEVGTAAAWYLYYKPSASTNYDSVYVTLNPPYTLSNLSANTLYNIYIKADCDSGYSTLSPVVNFRTACGVVSTLPWTEGFETTPWATAVTPGNALAPNCWFNINGGYSSTSYIWRRTSTADYVHSGTGAAQMSSGGATYATNDWLITPSITLNGNERLRFWAKGYSTYLDQIGVRIYDITTNLTDISQVSDTSLFTEIMPNTLVSATSWTEYEINLSQYSGDYRIAFVRNTTGGNYLNLDDVSISTIPTCVRPSSITSSSSTQNSIDLSWTNGNASDAAWYVYYAPTGTTIYDSVLASSNPFTLTGLNASTGYNIYIRTVCGSDLSEATNILTLYSACGAITSFPWIEGFESNWFPAVAPGNQSAPNCWTVIDKGGVLNTYQYWWKKCTTSPSHTGYSHAACFTNYGTTGHNDWLITPQLSLTGNERLRFWAMRSSSTSTEPDEISIFISDGNITSLDTIGMGVYGDMQGFTQIFNQMLPEGNWQQYEVNLRQYTGTRYIAFVRQNTPDGYNLRLDDVSVEPIPACARPTQLATTAVSQTTADFSWLPGHVVDASWYLYYKTSTATTYDSIQVTSEPYQLQNLTSNTIYNAFVKTDCSTELSEASPIITFHTPCDAIMTLPYTEAFDTYGTGSPIIPTCWRKITTYTTYPYLATTYYSSPASLYFYAAAGSYNIATTPPFDSSIPINTLLATFKMKKANATSNVIVGVMTNPNDPSTFDTIAIVAPTETTTWDTLEVNFSSYQGTGEYIAFKSAYNTTNNYFYLDDLLIDAIPTCPNTYSLAVASVTPYDITLNWSSINSAGVGWEISYDSIETGFDPATGIIVSVSDAIGVPPYTITGLIPSTIYSFAVRQACGGEWSNVITVNTIGLPAQLPYTCDFEDVNEQNSWSISNGDATNRWFIGTAVSAIPITGTSLYISNNNGVSNTYNLNTISTVVASRLIEFDGAEGYTLTFNSKLGGESYQDYLKVYVVDQDTTFAGDASTPYYGTTTYSAGAVLYNGTNAYFVGNPTTVNNHSIELPYQGVAGTVKKIMFVWRNDNVGGTQPPASIDNITITPITCETPVLTISNIAQISADASLTATTADATWWLYWKEASATNYDSIYVTGTPSYSFTTLTANTAYNAYVRLDCGTELSSPSVIVNFRTACATIASFPFSENFDNYGTGTAATSYPSCWTRGVTTYTTNYPYISTTNNSAPGAMYFYAYNSTRTVAVCPPVDPTIPINTLSVTFKMRYSTIYASGLQVGIMTDPSDFATFVPVGLPQVIDAINIWENKSISLSSYTGTGTYIALAAIAPASGYSCAYVDDFRLDYTPVCPNVYGITAGVASTTSVSLSWDNSYIDPTGWNIAYSATPLVSFDPTTATIVPVASTETLPYVVPNLTAGATYTFAVQNGCGGNWSIPKEITLPASAITLPYSQNFEDTTLVSEWMFTSSNATHTDMWDIGAATGNTGNSMYVSSDGGLTNSYVQFSTYTYATALVEFGQSSEFALSFDWKGMGESGYDKFSVYALPMSSPMPTAGYPTGGATLLSPVGSQSTWQTVSISLSSAIYSNTTQRLIFVWYSNGSTNTNPPSAVDNIVITGLDCGAPISVATANGVGTSVDVTFTPAGANDAAWYVYYKPSTSTDWDSIASSSTTTTLSNLTLQTIYQIYVKTDCGNGLYSNASTIITYTTPCYASAISFPWTEGFENGISCWTINSSIPSADWTSVPSGTSPTATPHGGSNMIMFNSNNLASQWSIIYSPVLDFPNDQYQVSFWLFRDNNDYLTTPDRVELYINSTSSATGATLLGTINRSYSLAPVETSGGWHQYSFTLPAGTTGNQYVILKGIAENGRNIYVDDLTLDTPCQAPTTVAVSNITTTTADVSWTAGSTETTWEVRLGTTGTPVTVTTPTYQLPGLTPGTNYTVYVRANCGTGYSSWVASTPFTTTSLLTVVTLPQTSVTPISAILHGTVTPGTATILSQGFEWKETSATTWTVQPATGTTISYTLPSLTPSTAYTYRAFAMTATDTVRGIDVNFTTLAIVPPTVVTNNASLVLQTTATLNGTVTAGTETVTAKGFDWRVVGTTTWNNQPITTATLTYNLTALTANTSYEYRAYATTATNTYYGTTQNFSTLAIVPPTVITNSPTAITQTIATLNGTITEGSEIITYQGFEWKLASETNWTTVSESLVGNVISHNLTGLTANTTYNFKTFATTASGTIYGTIQNFNTLHEGITSPTVVTNPATTISQTVATLNGTITAGSESITDQGFEWKLASVNTWTQVSETLVGNAITHNLTGLTANTAYDFKAYAITATGTVYGTTQTFTTLAIVPPSVTTNPATVIAQTIATLNGTVNAGSETITAQGFDWRQVGTTNWNNQPATGALTYNLTGLTASTQYEFRAFATTATNTYYGTTQNFSTLAIVPPTVTTMQESGVTQTTATLNGTVTPGSENISAQGFEWKLASTSSWNTQPVSGTTITYTLNGLTASTIYEFRAFATTATNTYYGTTMNFTTDAIPVVLGEVTTQIVSSLLDHSATLNGSLVSTGNAVENIEIGFVYSTVANPVIGGANVITDTVTYAVGMTTFNKSISGLLSETNYYYKAYITNSAGTAYGDEQPFLTSGLNDVIGDKFSVAMYPNPTKNTTKLVVSGVEGETDIIINDVQGKLIYKTTAKAENGKVEQTLDVNNFAKGVYYVRIQNQTTNRTQKLIIID